MSSRLPASTSTQNLEDMRRKSAEALFESMDIPGFEAANGWEWMANEWTRAMFIADPENPDADTRLARLRVTFEADSSRMLSASVDGEDLLNHRQSITAEV